MNPARELVRKYLWSRSQFAEAEFGSCKVVLEQTRNSGLPDVSVSWPSIGSVDPLKAIEFSANICAASAFALSVENIIRSWDTDQWVEPDDRTADYGGVALP